MPCAYASTFRAGQPWDKPGHDETLLGMASRTFVILGPMGRWPRLSLLCVGSWRRVNACSEMSRYRNCACASNSRRYSLSAKRSVMPAM
jgi:hypothetical protein